MLELRNYQRNSLDALESYLRLTKTHGGRIAFNNLTNRSYCSVPQLPELPYVCLRVPTGGGKTLMACHTIGIVAIEMSHVENPVCLWLVPSNTIRDQTLVALRNRHHPYRQAVDERFSCKVSVMDLKDALSVRQGTLGGEMCIIVSTLAALRVEDTDGRKVYESAGDLMSHFSGLTAEKESYLERRPDGTTPYSLCNVLRLWRPVVIMDEAHNARTTLSFDTLARFNPSCIVEFTATPQIDHHPDREEFASNVLHHVSAAELKAEEMVKLPIKLETHADWKGALGKAREWQHRLEQIALAEERETGEYIRPIVLIQAQAKSSTKQTITVEVVKECLLNDFQIRDEQVAIATGNTREIDDVNLFDRTCPIRFIITVQALKEGWDCSFAYVFCSVADVRSARAAEQLLGRVLRMPQAKRKRNPELNFAYAVVSSTDFLETANALKDKLVENGFARIEANQFIQPYQMTLPDSGPLINEVIQPVSEVPNLAKLSGELRERVTFDPVRNELTVTGDVTESDRAAIANCFQTTEGQHSADAIFQKSHGRRIQLVPVAVARPPFRIPLMAIRQNGQLELFEETHFREVPWELADCDATLSESEFPSVVAEGKAGELDVSDQGRLEVRFVEQVQRQLSLMIIEPGWDVAGLTNWLDRQIPHPDLTRTQSTLFIHRLLTGLLESRTLTIEQLARQKFRLRSAIGEKIDHFRQKYQTDAFNRMLFRTDGAEIEVGPEFFLEFSADQYAANGYYDGAYRFGKHYFPLIGELKPEGEEFDCAAYLDQHPKVQWWVRNLERRPQTSFWLQTATDRFYPDFVCLLTDGRILVVEYKGEDRWSNDDSKEKRAIGELWANRSHGKCLFVMPKGPDRREIERAIAT